MMWASRALFFAAFAGYVLSTIVYVARLGIRRRAAAVAPGGFQAVAVGAGGQRSVAVTPSDSPDGAARWAGWVMAAAVAVHGVAILLRWAASGQAPMSNLYEYMSLTGWAAMLFFVLLNRRYRVPALGAFAAPVGVLVIAYASVFPQEVQPLVPALQSYWLVLHVTLAALAEGAFAVAFAAALLFLLNARRSGPLSRSEEVGLEAIFCAGAGLAGFVAVALAARAAGYVVAVPQGAGGAALTYHLPPLVAPAAVAKGALGSFAGLPLPLWHAPAWMAGVAAPRQFNTLVVSLLAGLILYAGVRLLARRPWRDLLTPPVAGLDPDTLDDISYRGIAIGFPLFTLGALVFGMIWAEKAWGAYWSWDPKETWSLISWLFYAGYLHMRIVRGWSGRPAAWTAALGFVLILFTLVGVNLLIAGLHSYAGG